MYTDLSDYIQSLEENYGRRTALYIRRRYKINKYSYSELVSNSKKVSAFFESKGIKSGDKILIWAPNMPEWTILLLGCFLSGVVIVPVNVNSSPEILEKYINQTKAKLLFKSRYIPLDPKDNVETIILEDLIELISPHEDEWAKVISKNQNDLAEIVFTSGTTGTPKGVMITRKNLITQLNQLIEVIPESKEYRMLSVLPMSHVMEQVVGVLVALHFGATIYYLPRVNGLTVAKALKKYRITHMGVVPQVLKILLDKINFNAEQQGKLKQLNFAFAIAPYLPVLLRRLLFRSIHKELGGSLKLLGCGSAPLQADVAKKWMSMGVKIIEGYGLSETTGAITVNTDKWNNINSVGKPLSGITIKMGDENEVLAKGENITPGYFEDANETSASFTKDGYFKTGDVGFLDNENYLHLNGRLKFKIVTAAGDKIYPEDIERVINTFEAVKDSCVLGINHGDGEVVHVVLLLNKISNTDELIRDINLKLEAHQKIVEFTIWQEEDFPRMHTLKVDRNKLRDRIINKSEDNNSEVSVRSEDKLIDLISTICNIAKNKISAESNLSADLHLDSLRRATLVAVIEDEYSIEISETDINESTTVNDLRKLINNPRQKKPSQIDYPAWPKSKFAETIRELLRENILFKLQDHYIQLKVEGKENLKLIKPASILIFNHVGYRDESLILRLIDKEIRRKTFIMADSVHYDDKFMKFIFLFGGHAYSLDKRGGPVKQSLEFITDMMDDGYTLLLTPEGDYNWSKGILPFKQGIGLIAVETGAPVSVFKIENYDRLYPGRNKFPHLPQGKGEVLVKVSKPIKFSAGTSYEDATFELEKIMKTL